MKPAEGDDNEDQDAAQEGDGKASIPGDGLSLLAVRSQLPPGLESLRVLAMRVRKLGGLVLIGGNGHDPSPAAGA
jgi:hypothetical protein